MKIIEPSVELINAPSYETLLTTIEAAGRTCYKSEDKIKDGSAERFIRSIIKRGHESVIEHGGVTVRFICDRGISHEIVRHRIPSYSQESTRYCNYSNAKFNSEITVIRPSCFTEGTSVYRRWKASCEESESAYFDLLGLGCTPENARAVLPTTLKTELVATMNMREWRHFFKMRYSHECHPDMQVVTNILLRKFKELYPVFFEDFELCM